MKKRDYKTITIATVLGIFIFMLAALVIGAMNGNVKTTTVENDPEKNSSLKCTSKITKYPFFEYDHASKRELEISLIFDHTKLKSIALNYTLYYDSPDKVKESEAKNHAAMNIGFSNNNLEQDAFSATYSKLSDALRLNLFADGSEINKDTSKYFMISVEDGGDIPKTIGDFRKLYHENGLKCSIDK